MGIGYFNISSSPEDLCIHETRWLPCQCEVPLYLLLPGNACQRVSERHVLTTYMGLAHQAAH